MNVPFTCRAVDGQKVLLSIMNMGGESRAAWAEFLGDLDARGLQRPEFVIVDGAPGLEAALVALWGEELPIQRCTVHKHRNLLGHAPKRMQDELTEDYRDMIYAVTAAEIDKRRKAFLRPALMVCKQTTAGHVIYDGQWRGSGRSPLGHYGPSMSMVAPVFSTDLNGYVGFGPV